MASSVYDFTVKKIDGKEINLEIYKGKPLLIINTASKCGFTPQFKGLEDIYEQLKEFNMEILGFPCNQFGSQDPGSDEEIKNFCDITYQISFPMFSKVEVKGNNAHPLFEYLSEKAPGIMGTRAIKWNFTKFLIDSHGAPIKRYAPKDTPADVLEDIKNVLATPQ